LTFIATQAASNASTLGADPSQGFTIGGTSAGGNITVTISHLWRDEKQSPPITGCHLMIPAVVSAAHVPEEFAADFKSWSELPNAPILSHKACNLFVDNFIPEEKRAEPMFSPLLWPSGHSGLPPAYFQICGADPLRDEALIYERLLREKESTATKVDM
jgi:acetyl esterase/lipase